MTYKKCLLFSPGPIRVPSDIKKILAQDPPYFAHSDFMDLLKRIQPKLREIFRTRNQVLIGTGSGSLGMEMCVSNFFSKKDAVIVLSSGKYGENWIKICKAYGLRVIPLRSTPGEIISPEEFRKSLEITYADVRGVFVQHVETTTATLSPINKYLEVVNDYNKRKNNKTLLIVDAVCSLLSEELQSDMYDVVISASQKALSLPAGLFFITCSDKALEFAKKSDLPKFYFDVLNELDRSLQGITTFTPASSLILALDTALDNILKIGVSDILESTRTASNIVKERLGEYFKPFGNSPTSAVSAFICKDSNDLVKYLYTKDIVIGSGVRELNNKIFRIMHFGYDLFVTELVEVIIEIERYFIKYSNNWSQEVD